MSISENLRLAVMERDGYRCRYCGRRGSREGILQIDHVYPQHRGGETTLENLVTACIPCNKKKHNQIGIWPKPIGYFDNPFRRMLTWLERALAPQLMPGFVYKQEKTRMDALRIELVEVHENGRQTTTVIDLPYPDRLPALARQIMAMRYHDFNMSSFGGPGKLYSRGEYTFLRDELLMHELAEWVNPRAHNLGVRLTNAGLQVMRRMVEIEERNTQ